MGFRLELAFGNGKPKYWEVGCDYCTAISHFPVERFATFPDAFNQSFREGWDCKQDGHGRHHYSCPSCAVAALCVLMEEENYARENPYLVPEV